MKIKQEIDTEFVIEDPTWGRADANVSLITNLFYHVNVLFFRPKKKSKCFIYMDSKLVNINFHIYNC